ncbi:MAG: hypothetical protein M3P11_12725 [Actinomycetota bacterium]|nr:hypothetical protein [Actinomycetota bacterium]
MEDHLTRRKMLLTLGGAVLGVAASACSHPRSSTTPAPGSIDALTEGAGQLSMLGPTTPVNPGPQPFAFFLLAGQSLLAGAQPSVWYAKDPAGKAAGPIKSSWYPLQGYDATHDTSPRSPLAIGVYVADVDLTSTGIWTIAASVMMNGRSLAGTSAVPVTTDQLPAAVGSKARPTRTPVATTMHGLEEICTRRPPDAMHYISLDDATRNGKPTVVSFATPLLCQSQTCGPVVDEQILVFEQYGPQRANFIHVEEFLPGRDLQPAPATPQNLSPGFKAWSFQDEPWVIVIDRMGIIRSRLGPGATAAPQIEAALRPLL